MKPVCCGEIVVGQGECCFRERKPRGSLNLEACDVSRCVMSTYVGCSENTSLCLGVRCGVPWAGDRILTPT